MCREDPDTKALLRSLMKEIKAIKETNHLIEQTNDDLRHQLSHLRHELKNFND